MSKSLRFKRILSAILAVSMVFALPVAVMASEAGAGTAAPLPLRAVFEAAGAEVLWADDGTITVNYGGDVLIFSVGSGTAYRNGEQISLAYPVFVDEHWRSVIQYDDVAFLFEGESELFRLAKRTAVTQGYHFSAIAGIPGITVALVHRDTGYTWTQGIGWADTANNRFVNENTLFDTGSIVKSFTAILIMQLVEQGLIELDTPIVTYLPDFYIQPHPVYGGDYRNITPRMLLSHVSGIATDIFCGMATLGGRYAGYMNNLLENLAQMHMDNAELNRFAYANIGYVLLGVLAASMNGHDNFFEGFDELIRENILVPAGMGSSGFDVGLDSYIARPYISTGICGIEALGDLVLASPISTGGLFSNAHDMARFMHMMLNGGSIGGEQILAEDSVRQMRTVQDFDFALSPSIQTGLGLYRMVLPGGFTSIGHGGNFMFYHSEMIFDFDAGIGVFVSTNSVGGAGTVVSLATDILAAAVYEKTGVPPPSAQPLAPSEPVELPREQLERVAGFYVPLGWLRVSDENVLYFDLTEHGLGILEYTPLADGSFMLNATGNRYWFEEINGIMAALNADRTAIVVERIDDFWYADENFARWVGTYAYHSQAPSSHPSFPFAFIGVNAEGWATFNNAPLIRVDDYTYFIAGTGRNLGAVIRFWEEGGNTYLQWAGTTFVKN